MRGKWLETNWLLVDAHSINLQSYHASLSNNHKQNVRPAIAWRNFVCIPSCKDLALNLGSSPAPVFDHLINIEACGANLQSCKADILYVNIDIGDFILIFYCYAGSSCSVHLINEGVEVRGHDVTVQFLGGSSVQSYLCKLGDSNFHPCEQLTFNASVMSKISLNTTTKLTYVYIISSFDRDCLWPHSQGLPSCILWCAWEPAWD